MSQSQQPPHLDDEEPQLPLPSHRSSQQQQQPPHPDDEEPQLPLLSHRSSQQQQQQQQQPIEHPAVSSSSSQPSSTGSSTKRPAPEDDISELVRKAKASCYAQPVRKSDDDDIADTLERDLSCAICSEVLNNPVACFDCLHNFCGSCLVPWLERINTCPTCRRVVKKIGDNHSTAALIETLLTRFPDKRRDAAELKELEKVYKPGQKVYIEEASPDDDDDDDHHSDSDDDRDDSHIAWPPCPCCVPGNPYGHTCPDPIPATDPPHRVDTYSYRNHVHCQQCPNTIPTTWKSGYKCESCGTLNCGALFGCTLPGVLAPPAAQVYHIAPPDPAFHNNRTERHHFESWRGATQTSYLQIAQMIYEWVVAGNGGEFPALRRSVGTDAYVCRGCVAPVLQARFMAWWCAERVKLYVDSRDKCWYGWGCRTQFHNSDHARKLQHCCPVVPEAERRAPRARGDGAVIVGGPVVDLGPGGGPVVDLGPGGGPVVDWGAGAGAADGGMPGPQ
ncbi:hypothetical protein DFP73DRAFT_242268 [Morchella snyderi]|nr:hypothetical protein DFP73DRAFT_242268 [Morchella snyderi]